MFFFPLINNVRSPASTLVILWSVAPFFSPVTAFHFDSVVTLEVDIIFFFSNDSPLSSSFCLLIFYLLVPFFFFFYFYRCWWQLLYPSIYHPHSNQKRNNIKEAPSYSSFTCSGPRIFSIPANNKANWSILLCWRFIVLFDQFWGPAHAFTTTIRAGDEPPLHGNAQQHPASLLAPHDPDFWLWLLDKRC